MTGSGSDLRVLITNIEMWPPSGTVVYVRDLALELKRQGHTPTVFSSTSGQVVEELRDAGILVTDKLGRVPERPDLIHGHHYLPTLVALRHWPSVPAIHVCHDHRSWIDATPIHQSIRRHFGVSRLCVQRLLRDGIPASSANLQLNFVDTERFKPRATLPERPRKALVFSNYAHAGSHLPAVMEACAEMGLELDVVGAGVGRISSRPELLLADYDIVFGKAKAAMEAMAVGSAVVLCDVGGVGPMVTSTKFNELRPLNFGHEALSDPLEAEPLLREIARYDPRDAARVRDRLRSEAGLISAVAGLIAIYREAIAEPGLERARSSRPSDRPSLRDSLAIQLYRRWSSLARTRRERLKRLPGARLIKHGWIRLHR